MHKYYYQLEEIDTSEFIATNKLDSGLIKQAWSSAFFSHGISLQNAEGV